MIPRKLFIAALALALLAGSSLTGRNLSAAETLSICASTTDAANLVEWIGGDQVSVFCFSKGKEDPHDIELRSQFVRMANKADLMVINGMGVENPWLHDLENQAGNPDVFQISQNLLDLSSGVNPVKEEDHHDEEEGEEDHHEEGEDEEGEEHADEEEEDEHADEDDGEDHADEEEGDDHDGEGEGVHAEGNPHYMLDPVEGLRAAAQIKDKLTALQPESANYFAARHKEFTSQWVKSMLGEKILEQFDLAAFVGLRDISAINDYLTTMIEAHSDNLAGVFGAAKSLAGTAVIGDHDLWAYFARRFNMEVIGYLEAHPGVTPSPRHLTSLIKEMKENDVKVILKSPFFSMRAIRPVSRATGAKVASIAHQVGASSKANDYLSLFDWNLEQIISAIR